MYLSHHYAVDLVGGGLLAAIAFYAAKTNFLPRVQPGKIFRWDYDFVERGDPLNVDSGYGLTPLDVIELRQDSSDEWSVGTSSSVSGSPIDENGSSWEGETLASPASESDLNEIAW